MGCLFKFEILALAINSNDAIPKSDVNRSTLLEEHDRGGQYKIVEILNKLVIRGLRLKLLWGKSLAAKAELENHDDEAARQAALAHGGMLPRAVISQQQNQQVPPPGTQDQPPPMHYFNIPPPPPERAYYPSMDPQRMGALVPSQEASGSGPPLPLRSNMDT
ncbi:hypothetical protein Syun_018014 [Stephania yunnanensis]|uniref:Uncharacterized protein n=1 Tax=Stephania yunnanensis TaxID=152371 RepID=A0AAP0NUM0_9MAGN